MKFIGIKKVRDGKYLKNYELTYINKAGNEKKFEIVSRNQINCIDEVGKFPSGVSIVALKDGEMLLLQEFRMGVNQTIYNLCAGSFEGDETVEECIARELYEETGLQVKEIIDILPPSYAAVAISDVSTYFAFVEVEGTFSDHTSANEAISPHNYSKGEVKSLLQT